MTILHQSKLFILGGLLFTGSLLSTGSSADPTKESFNTEEEMRGLKQNTPKKEENRKSDEAFLNRVKNLPKESLEKTDNARLSPGVRNRKDRFWINKEGKSVLLESM